MVLSPRILLIDTEEAASGITKVNLRGRLDAAGARAMDGTFSRLAGTQQQLIVDMSRVSFIASTGLRTLIAGARGIAERGGRMAVLQPEPSVESVLIGSGIDQIIPVCRTLPDAVLTVSLSGVGDEPPETTTLSFSRQIDRSQDGIRRLSGWVDELAMLLNLTGRAEYALRLCLEEAVTNIIAHGVPEPNASADTVTLRLAADPSRLSVTIQDQCRAFNPLDADPLETNDTALEGRGGIGLRLLRQHARDLSWSRIGQTNRLAMTISR